MAILCEMGPAQVQEPHPVVQDPPQDTTEKEYGGTMLILIRALVCTDSCTVSLVNDHRDRSDLFSLSFFLSFLLLCFMELPISLFKTTMEIAENRGHLGSHKETGDDWDFYLGL